MEEVWEQTSWKSARFENVAEMISLIGKKRMFEDWCFEKEQKGTHCILLDDSFGNTTLINHDLDVIVETADVNNVLTRTK